MFTLQLFAKEVVCNVIAGSQLKRWDDLMNALEERTSKRKIVKLWVEILVKLFLVMFYIWVECEGDWLLLAPFRQMPPFYFAVGRVYYTRYGLYYLNQWRNFFPRF